MHEFSVWAPAASRVEVRLESGAVALKRRAGGWWHARVEDARAGTRYGFSLDGGPARPDPRSRSQPDGVEGLSELVDDDAFPWSDHGWRGVSLRGAVLYELHVGTFTERGTFEAVIDRLPHLRALGVDAIELLPVAEFAGDRGWGYDGVDLFSPHHAYGGPQGLKRLIDACHGAGIGVVIDVVFNHLGPAGNYLGEFGGYFSDAHHTRWGATFNYDGPGSDEVRRFVIDNALMWLRDYHADGLRLDAVHAIVDTSARHVLEELTEEIDALATHLGRPLFVIAESDRNDPRLVRSRDAGGLGVDAVWADDWHHALHSVLSGEQGGYYADFGSLSQLRKALRQGWVYDGIGSVHRQRRHGRSPEGLSGHRFVVFSQNHDQVGNRALGERTGALMSEGRLRIAAALLLTSPFTPLLFQGEEWGASSPFRYFTDHEPVLGRAVSEGRRSEFAAFGWPPDDVPDPQAPSTFQASKLDWGELQAPPHAGLLEWHRELVRLRRLLPALSDPRLTRIRVELDPSARVLVVGRGELELLVNVGTSPYCFEERAALSVLAASDAAVRVDAAGISVPPDAVAIVRLGGAPGSEAACR